MVLRSNYYILPVMFLYQFTVIGEVHCEYLDLYDLNVGSANAYAKLQILRFRQYSRNLKYLKKK